MHRRQLGFNLVELSVATTILAILSALALPSLASLVSAHRLATVTNELHTSLVFTRSEAIKRGRRVSLCTSSDLERCVSGVGWHSGWIVFEDPNGTAQREEGETVLYAARAAEAGVVVTGNTPVRNYVSYLPSGRTALTDGALQMGTITACGEGRARRIVISATGRARLVREAECGKG